MNWLKKKIRAWLEIQDRPDNTCFHKWEIDQQYEIIQSLTGRVVGQKIIQRCSKCGDLKSFEINLHDKR